MHNSKNPFHSKICLTSVRNHTGKYAVHPSRFYLIDIHRIDNHIRYLDVTKGPIDVLTNCLKNRNNPNL